MLACYDDIVPPRKDVPVYIAGPCSAESELQVLKTAEALSQKGVTLFRAGVWKPRTRPGHFEGVGIKGLKWLKRVQEEFGMEAITEVGTIQHIAATIDHGLKHAWLGARTTSSPFAVQEIAYSLSKSNLSIYVKNPVNPDINLWLGAVERLYRSGVRKLGAIHRGFSYYGEGRYRNMPMWQIALNFRQRVPGIQFICDNSHISGQADLLFSVAHTAMHLGYDGLMTEVHITPNNALSDARQQITPSMYLNMLSKVDRFLLMGSPIIREVQAETLQNELQTLEVEIADLKRCRSILKEVLNEKFIM